MKYTPRSAPDDINRPRGSLLKEFIKLFSILMAVTVILYIAAGFGVDILARSIAPETEQRLGGYFSSLFQSENIYDGEETLRLRGYLSRLLERLDEPRMNYSIFIKDTEEINAVAIPGGSILFYRGLYDLLKDDSEALAFVVAHEIGHFENRDHLRSMGRGVVILALMLPFYGSAPSSVGPASVILDQLQMKYSRDQERKADLFAARILYEEFGSTDGAVRALEKMGEKASLAEGLSYFSTHPPSSERIRNIENIY